MGLGGFAAQPTPYSCVGTGARIWIFRGALGVNLKGLGLSKLLHRDIFEGTEHIVLPDGSHRAPPRGPAS